MADGEVVTGTRGTRPTGHGSKNRGHREKEGEQGISARPIWRSKDAAGAGVTMAGYESTRPHVKRALEATKQEINCTGRERGER